MFTRPLELSDEAIRASLAEHWAYDASSLTYAPVGFGAHHWRATRAGSDGDDDLFVTVHDLTAKRRDAETEDGTWTRLVASFSAAAALQGAGLDFVLAPVPGRDGRLVDRIDHRFTLAVHPWLDGRPAGADGELESDADRRVVLDLLVAVHATTSAARAVADRDDLEVPRLAEIPRALDALGREWSAGPYGERARALLQQHAQDLERLLVGYERLRLEVRPLLERAVLTHGEPHGSNVLVVDGRFLLIDWDTALLAPAERDLWHLEPGDRSILEAYRAATGLAPSPAALDLYRLWYDLTEIGGYLGELIEPHTDTDDIAESWKNLQHFLRPAERWPGLADRTSRTVSGWRSSGRFVSRRCSPPR